MDFFKQITDWVTANWGTFMIGTASLGTIITTVIFTVKNWLASKVQGTRIATMWDNSQTSIKELKELYFKEREARIETENQLDVRNAAQAVMFDAIIKIALSSKLDADDKVSIVAGVEKIKTMEVKEVIDVVKDKTTQTIETVNDVAKDIKANPAQTTVDVIKGVGSILEKYNGNNITKLDNTEQKV